MSDPVVWLLLGHKAGDNTQVRALAEELDYPSVAKTINARPWELLCHLLGGATLAGIDQASSSTLLAPWPDLVISAGRRNEPVARWIKQQTSGRCRLVHLGRPWAPLDCYDLIITTPQYFLPTQANVLHNSLPLHRLQTEQLQASARLLEPHVKALARPFTTVLVGGDSGRFVFTAAKGQRLGRAVNVLVQAQGGSVLLSNSPRTPARAFRALLQELTVPCLSYDCAKPTLDNPYLGYLALADQFVVTGESMSMLGEASAMGKPLHIFDMGDCGSSWWRQLHNYRYKPLSHRFAMRFAPQRMRRDVGLIQQSLVTSGAAHWLGESGSGVLREVLPEQELQRSAARVRQLF